MGQNSFSKKSVYDILHRSPTEVTPSQGDLRRQLFPWSAVKMETLAVDEQ